MASLDERVATLEAQSDKHAAAVAALRSDIGDLRLELRTEIAALRGEMALRSETAELRREIAAVRSEMARRSETEELRHEVAAVRLDLADMAGRSEVAELRSEMNRRFDAMDQKFVWLTGTQVATLLAVVGILAGALF